MTYNMPKRHHDNINNNDIINDNTSIVPDVVWKVLEEVRGISRESLYDWQHECLTRALSRNIVYLLPTSGGKTLVAEILLIRSVLTLREDALFILPFQAIVAEKVKAMSMFAERLGFMVEAYYGVRGRIPPRRHSLPCIYIATIEKAVTLVSHFVEENRIVNVDMESRLHHDRMSSLNCFNVGLVVVDEIHMLGEMNSRAACIETILSLLQYASAGHIHIVAMSATLADNDRNFIRFLNCDFFSLPSFRPVPIIRHHVTSGNGDVYLDNDLCGKKLYSLGPEPFNRLLMEMLPSRSVLVFCPSRAECERTGAKIAQLIYEARKDPHSPLATSTEPRGVALPADLASNKTSNLLRKMVTQGVSFHHAGLSTEQRGFVETSFREGDLKILCCTSTLAAGVNLPAERVIITSPRISGKLLSRTSYEQQSGRAGRAGSGNTKGESFLLLGPRDQPLEVLNSMRAPFPLIKSPFYFDRALLDKFVLTIQSMLRLSDDPEGDETILKIIRDHTLFMHCHDRGTSGVAADVHASLKRVRKWKGGSSEQARSIIRSHLSLSAAEECLERLRRISSHVNLGSELQFYYLIASVEFFRPSSNQWLALYTFLADLSDQVLLTDSPDPVAFADWHTIIGLLGIDICIVGDAIHGGVVSDEYRRVFTALVLRCAASEKDNAIMCSSETFHIDVGAIQTLQMNAAMHTRQMIALAMCTQCLNAVGGLLREYADFAFARIHDTENDLATLMQLPGIGPARAAALHRRGLRSLQNIAEATSFEVFAAINLPSVDIAFSIVNSARALLVERLTKLSD